MPVITVLLTPEEYGVFSMFEVVLLTTLPFVLVQQNGAIGVNYYRQTLRQNSLYISSVLVIPVVMLVVVFLVVFLLKKQISYFTLIPVGWLLIIPIVTFFQSIFLINSTTLVFRKKPYNYLFLEIGRTIVYFGGGMAALWFVSRTWDSLALLMTLGYCFFGCIALWQLVTGYNLKLKCNKTYLKDGMSYGLPLIVHVFAQSMIDLSDRYFITKMVGIEFTGIYNIAYRFGMINFFLFKFFQQAWNPHVYRVLENGTRSESIALLKQMIFIPIGILVLAFIVAWVAPFYIKFFLDPSYLLAISIIPWICSAYAFRSIYGLFSAFIFYKKKTLVLSAMTLLNAGVNLVLNYYLINLFGFKGAAIATLITFILSNIVLLLLLLFYYKKEFSQLRNYAKLH